jgi:hypothetical protein
VFVSGKPFLSIFMLHTSLLGLFVIYKVNELL